MNVSHLLLRALLQVLAMTMAEPGSRLSLKFKLEGTKGDLGRWGHEYLRSLAGEIGQEYSARRMRIVKGAEGAEKDGGEGGDGIDAMDADEGEVDVSDLIELVDDIVPFHLQHNAEAEAVDLLVEVQVKHRAQAQTLRRKRAESKLYERDRTPVRFHALPRGLLCSVVLCFLCDRARVPSPLPGVRRRFRRRWLSQNTKNGRAPRAG